MEQVQSRSAASSIAGRLLGSATGGPHPPALSQGKCGCLEPKAVWAHINK